MVVKKAAGKAENLSQIFRTPLTYCGLGMFLFAKLVMTTLFSQISREKLFNELDVKGIPEGLEAA
jgi:hypothetical protein